MTTEASSGIGFVRFWASAPPLNMVDIIVKNLKQEHSSEDERNGEIRARTGSVHGEDKRQEDEGTDGFLRAIRQQCVTEFEESGFHILLVGIGDLHHILYTCATAPAAKLHFYVLEESVEVLARLILLLDIITDKAISIRERVETFLDVYGNAFLLSKSAEYIERRVFPDIIDFICSERSHVLESIVDLSHLKYKDRDQIQDAMLSWRRRVEFDMRTLRDHRMRHCYGSRFDYKVNLVDWNYQMNLAPVASIIHWKQYKSFTMNGITFERRLADQTEPNRTLSSYAAATDTKRHQSVRVRGFWGDISNGPFFAYGVKTRKCYRERLFRKIHHQHRYNSQEIADFNLVAMLYILQEGKEISLPPGEGDDDKPPYPSPSDLLFRGLDAKPASVAPTDTEAKNDNEVLQKATENLPAEPAAQRLAAESSSSAEECTSKRELSPVELGCEIARGDYKEARENSALAPHAACKSIVDRKHEILSTEDNLAKSMGSSTTSRDEHKRGDAATISIDMQTQSVPTLLKGFQNTTVTFLKGDAAEVLRKPRYARLFDAILLANTATTSFLKECGILTAEELGKVAHQGNTLLPMKSDACISADHEEEKIDNKIGIRENTASSFEATDNYIAGCAGDFAPTEKINSLRSESFLSACLKPHAIVGVETFKYAATINSLAKIRFRSLVYRGASSMRWTLCNTSSVPPLVLTMQELENRIAGSAGPAEPSIVEATTQEAASDDYMIFATS